MYIGFARDPGSPTLGLLRAYHRSCNYPDLTREEIAKKLQISESALYRKLRQYGIGG